jgi:hypothetical protein
MRSFKKEVAESEKRAGHTFGNDFEFAVNALIQGSFSHLGHLRPGSWLFLPDSSHYQGKSGRK